MTKEKALLNYLTEHHVKDLERILADIAKHSTGEYQFINWNCGFGSITLTLGAAKKIVDSNLDEAAEQCAEQLDKEAEYQDEWINQAYLVDAFKCGAKWQKEQDQSTIELAEDHAYFAGSENTREKLIEKACEWIRYNRWKYEDSKEGNEAMEKDFRKAIKGE